MSSGSSAPGAAAGAAQVLAAHREVQTLRVAQAELGSLKPGRTVYEQQSGVWFLTSTQTAQEHVKARLAKAEKEAKLAEINART